ncbi:MAG: hypothetical protein OXH33_06155 [bacterium]|nr:hypothetical protein [bacterium]
MNKKGDRIEAGRRFPFCLRDERGAAETSTVLAWIVVGVLVVMALRAGLQTAGENVIDDLQTRLSVTTSA